MQKVMSSFIPCIAQNNKDLVDWDEKVNKTIVEGWKLVSMTNTPCTENIILAQAVFEKTVSVENPKKSIANSMIKTAQNLTSGRTLESAYLV